MSVLWTDSTGLVTRISEASTSRYTDTRGSDFAGVSTDSDHDIMATICNAGEDNQ